MAHQTLFATFHLAKLCRALDPNLSRRHIGMYMYRISCVCTNDAHTLVTRESEA